MSAPGPTPIYLDHNATTPMLPEVADAMRECWNRGWMNPASQHEFGRQARRVLEGARERIGNLLGAGERDSVLFTSGGTESNNLAIRGFVQRAGSSPPQSTDRAHVVISAVEHPSITALADELERHGHKVDRIPVDGNGVIRVDTIPQMLRHDTAVVAAILGQNETGVLQPVAELAAICAERGIPVHSDATQVAGKLPINFRDLGVATMTVAAHKFHGPVGIGALVCRDGLQLQPQLFGGFQQGGLRPGTESVALAVGMCRALELWYAEQRQRVDRLRQLRDQFERLIKAGWPDAVVIGSSTNRLPHTSHIALVGLDRQALFMALDQAGVACSTGSACASGSSEQSPALLAMGCAPAVLGSALRFSLGATTTLSEVEEAARRILHCCNELRRKKPG